MRILSCCFFHFFIFVLLLGPNIVATVPVPARFTKLSSSSLFSSRISILKHSTKNAHPGECDALLSFSDSFTLAESNNYWGCDSGTEYAKTASWKEGGSDCCSWDGVTCDPVTRHVIGLDLSCSWLGGPIMSNSSLFSLTKLRRLNLAGNDFNGSQIPSRFGIFTDMTHLNLSYSGFKGRVPLDEIISNLSGLISLDLSSSYNKNLTLEDGGHLGRHLRNLTHLRELILDWVDMSTIDPISLTNLSSTLSTLSLYFCKLQGTFPIDIFHYSNLRTLDLSLNVYLTGTLGTLTNWSGSLLHLDLSYTQFKGPIPASIGNLTSLNHLDLSGSSFTGPIPPTLWKLHHLIWLALGGNSFSGTVDFGVQQCGENCSMPRLQFLSLIGCGLTKFPYFLNSSSELTTLGLSYNKITGTIPEWFWRVGRDTLFYLDLASNSFTGNIPPSICEMHSLFLLELSYNALNGTLPSCLGNLSMLSNLGFSNNQMHGIVPRSLANCTRLGSLYLNSNEFHGSIAKIALPNGLYDLILSDNRFGGPLPILPPITQNYLVSNNNFTGDIPHQICNAASLEFIDLSNNSLTGLIPQCFRNFSDSLQVLDLRGNKFVGQIPELFNRSTILRTIRMSQNDLHGETPRSLAHCDSLEVLDVSGNKLEGHFPYWLDTLPNLKVLSLKSNRFYGPVVTSGKTDNPFPQLHIFDLSNNNFSGPLPINYIANFTAMKNSTETSGALYMDSNSSYYEDSIQIVMKGTEHVLEKILTVLTAIDLSSNSFEGEIPRIIGDLKALKGLNFSENKLTGNIPSSLGNLTSLEWMDLSSNKLNGMIPTELAGLTSLGILNLSNNHLEGQIPQSTQFDTFTIDSFSGNPGLCGHPLPKACGEDAGQTTSSTSQEEEEIGSGKWIEWRAVLMGYGCGLALAISAWYVMMETGRPWWLVGIIERWLLKIVEGKRLGQKTNTPTRNVHQKH